jgi:chitin synthase
VDVFKQQSGEDITKNLDKVLNGLDAETRAQNLQCLSNAFFVGEKDFRKSARCSVQNYLLIAASAVIVASMVVKCALIQPRLSIQS